MARHGKSNRSSRSRIQDVRIADPAAGSDGTKIDRIISQLKTSESQIRVLCGDAGDITPPATLTSTIYGFASIINSDDFQSMAQQFELYRITAVKYDIYDINPSAVVTNVWSTFHSEALTQPSYTRAQVADGPDSKVISGGNGQATLYWRAHGVEENRFQATNTAASTQQFFGGLRYSTQAVATGAVKYQLVVHAVVDFRGRL
jgi:hypothetical protein